MVCRRPSQSTGLVQCAAKPPALAAEHSLSDSETAESKFHATWPQITSSPIKIQATAHQVNEVADYS